MDTWHEERAAIEEDGEGQAAHATPSPRRAPGTDREEFLAQEYEDKLLALLQRHHQEQMGALRKLYGKLIDVERRVVAVERRAAAAPPPSGDGEGGGSGLDLKAVASDADLDGSHGDPMIKYDPKKWEGQSFKGYKFSETTPEYLDAMAKYLASCAYMAQKDVDEKKRKGARYKALDAARARGWAQRLRAGWGGAPANGPTTARSAGGEQPAGAPRAPAPATAAGDDVMF